MSFFLTEYQSSLLSTPSCSPIQSKNSLWLLMSFQYPGETQRNLHLFHSYSGYILDSAGVASPPHISTRVLPPLSEKSDLVKEYQSSCCLMSISSPIQSQNFL